MPASARPSVVRVQTKPSRRSSLFDTGADRPAVATSSSRRHGPARLRRTASLPGLVTASRRARRNEAKHSRPVRGAERYAGAATGRSSPTDADGKSGLERERGVEVELLESPPGLAHFLGCVEWAVARAEYRATSSRRSSRRSAWTAALSAPAATTTRSRYHASSVFEPGEELLAGLGTARGVVPGPRRRRRRRRDTTEGSTVSTTSARTSRGINERTAHSTQPRKCARPGGLSRSSTSTPRSRSEAAVAVRVGRGAPACGRSRVALGATHRPAVLRLVAACSARSSHQARQ